MQTSFNLNINKTHNGILCIYSVYKRYNGKGLDVLIPEIIVKKKKVGIRRSIQTFVIMYSQSISYESSCLILE